MRWFLFLLVLLIGYSQPVFSADKNDPKVANTKEQKQDVNRVAPSTPATKAEPPTDKQGDTSKEQHRCPFTNLTSWGYCIFLDTISDAGKLFTFGVAVFTFLAAVFTGLIYCEALDRGKKELRAYVGFEDIFFIFAGGHTQDGDIRTFTDSFKIRFKNHGQTPATNVLIGYERTEGEMPPSIPDNLKVPYGPLVLQPRERFGSRREPEPGGKFIHDGQEFFTYGRVTYQDIYARWWITEFCYHYRPKSEEGRGEFVPYGDYNQQGGPYKHRPSHI